MTTRSRGPLADFGWLQRGVCAAFRHPKPIFGGTAFLLLVCLLPVLLTLPLRFQSQNTGTPPDPAFLVAIMAGSLLLGLLIVPLYAGYLQVIDARRDCRNASASRWHC